MFRDTTCYNPTEEAINTGKQVSIPWDVPHLYTELLLQLTALPNTVTQCLYPKIFSYQVLKIQIQQSFKETEA